MISSTSANGWGSDNNDGRGRRRKKRVDQLRAGTIFFLDPAGERHEKTIFGEDLTKIVKSLVNYATILQLNGFMVSGSMVEELDKYWENTTEGAEYEQRKETDKYH